MINYFEIFEIDANTWRIKNVVNSLYIYVLRGKNKTLIIDTGYGIGNLKQYVFELTNQPQIVINTHGHPDHIYGNVYFEEVLIHKADVLSAKQYFKKIIKHNNFSKVELLPIDFSIKEWKKLSFDNFIPIDEGYIIDLGDRELRVIHIPGHTAGSIALYDINSKYLFSGDSIIKGQIWLHCPESLDITIFSESIMKLLNIKISQIFPAHTEDSIEASILHEINESVNKIISKSNTGIKVNSYCGKTRKYIFDNVTILYGNYGIPPFRILACKYL